MPDRSLMGNKRTLPNAIAMSTGSATSGKRNDPLGWRAAARRTVRFVGMKAPQPPLPVVQIVRIAGICKPLTILTSAAHIVNY